MNRRRFLMMGLGGFGAGMLALIARGQQNVVALTPPSSPAFKHTFAAGCITWPNEFIKH